MATTLHALRAHILVILGSVCFSLMGLFVKEAHKHSKTSTFGLLAVRNGLGLLLNGGVIAARGKCQDMKAPLSRKDVIWLVVRCLAGFGCVTLEFKALQVLPLAVNTMILYSSPLFIVIWAYVLLGEEVQLMVALCMVVCFSGLLVIVQPWRHHDSSTPLWAFGMTLVAAMLAGLAYVSLKELKHVSHYTVLNAFQASFLVLCLAFGSCLNELHMPELQPSVSRAWIFIVAAAVMAYLAELCITVGFALAQKNVGQVAIFKFISPICSVLWGILFLNEEPTLRTYVGAALILGPSAYVVYAKRSSSAAAAVKEVSAVNDCQEVSSSCPSSDATDTDDSTSDEESLTERERPAA